MPDVVAGAYARAVTRTARLITVALLNLALVAGLVTAGLTAHSLAVLAAGGDYLADAAAIGGSLLAIRLAARPPTTRHPRGHPRATTYAALVNTVLLAAVALAVIAGASRRLAAGAPTVHGLPVVVAAGTAAMVMLAAGLIAGAGEDGEGDGDSAAGGGSEGDRANMRAVVLDTLADSAAAAGAAVTGGIILADPGLSWLDPAVALAIAAVVGYHALKLLRDVIRVLRRPAVPPQPPGRWPGPAGRGPAAAQTGSGSPPPPQA